jgi:hypothetical protein
MANEEFTSHNGGGFSPTSIDVLKTLPEKMIIDGVPSATIS